jgi:diguanylate cyclase (GGDEF)-like protein
MFYWPLAVLMACSCWQCELAAAEQVPLRHYGQADGLANQAVTSIEQDGSGYLWVGTENGLFRFDGVRFQRYAKRDGLPEASITALKTDADGYLWAGTAIGLCRMVHDRCVGVPAPDGTPMALWTGQRLALNGGGVMLVVSRRDLLEIRSGTVAGTWKSRYYFSEEQRRAQPLLSDIGSIAVGTDGALWMGCGRQVCRYGPDGLKIYGVGQGVPSAWWAAIFAGKDGVMWLRSQNHLLSVAPGAANANAHTPPGVRQVTVRRYFPMAQDKDGTLVSNNDYGLLRGMPDRWREYGAKEGLKADGGISAIFTDRDGELWLGLAGHGLVQWQGYRNVENWTSAQGLPNDDIWSFYRSPDGALYLGTGRGLTLRRPGEAGFHTGEGGYTGADHQISSITNDHVGNLWSSTFSGVLIRQDHRTGRIVHIATLPLILRLLIDKAGQLWIITNRGLYVIADPERSSEPLFVDALLSLTGKAREELTVNGGCQTGDGALWFVTDTSVLRLANGRWSMPKVPGPVNMLSCDAHNLWLASGREATVWYGPADVGGALQLQPLPLSGTPLAGHSIMSMHIDRHHWLWLGTDEGVLVWNGTAWRTINQQGGLIWNDTNQYAIFEDVDGSMWIGTSSGASHILQTHELFERKELALLIESVSYGGRQVEISAKQPIAWGDGALEIKLAALSFRNHEALRFRYRLKGLENDWSDTDASILRYPALAPGHYVLQVSADNPVLQASAGLVELPLTITPPWWRSDWFYALYLQLALAMIWLLYRWRLRGVLRRNAEMEQLVRQRTTELEASREEHRMRSLKDGLTKAWNRGAIMEMISQHIAATARSGGSFMVVLMDLDHFKQVNDTYGHLAGDAVLKEFVRRLSERLRGTDVIGRYGGEEFIMLLPGLYVGGGEQRISELHREICADPVQVDDGIAITISASFGVVVGPLEGCTPESLIKLADKALYRAKENGRNRVEYSERHESLESGQAPPTHNGTRITQHLTQHSEFKP